MDKVKTLEEKMLAIVALAENFERNISPQLLQIWLEALQGYTPEQVNAGVRKVISEYSYKTLPPFAVLKKAIESACGIVSREEAICLMATAEWHTVLKTIRKMGQYAEIAEFHSTTAFMLRCMGGWRVACQWLETELQWRQRDFVLLWQQAFSRENALSQGAAGILQLNSAENLPKQTEIAAQNKVLAITHALTSKQQ